jgi:hypothetical protein
VRRDDAINALKAIKAIKATSHAPRGDHDADNLTDTPVAV